LAFTKFKRFPILSFGILWFFISLAPTSNLLVPISGLLYEHWLYLPMIGIFLILIWLGIIATEKYSLQKVLAGIFIIFFVFLSWRTIERNKDWKDPITFYNQTLKYAPNSYRVINNLGMAYADQNDHWQAEEMYKRAINLDLANPVAYHNLGNTYRKTGEIDSAIENFKTAISQATAGQCVSEHAQIVVQRIIDNLTTAQEIPDKSKEIEAIRKVCRMGKMRQVKLTKVDVFIEDKFGELFLFDIKTAKPNVGGFKEFKRTLLEWVAAVLADDPKKKVNTAIAIPYNPYEPKPYTRWTMRGMLDMEKELKVADDFWNFLGGKGAYQNLLDCFEEVGIELRIEIDAYFSKFKNRMKRKSD